MPRLLEHINFPKVVTVLAVTFGIALGACGLTALAGKYGPADYLIPLGMAELGLILLSAVALVVTVIAWVAIGDRGAGVPGTIKLFDESEKSKTDR